MPVMVARKSGDQWDTVVKFGWNAGDDSSTITMLSTLPWSLNFSWHWHHQSLVQTQTSGSSQVVGPEYPRPPHCPYSGTVLPVGTGAVTVV